MPSTSAVRIDSTHPREPSPAAVWAGALLTFAVVFTYRWLTVNFTNDQFVPLSRARQILLGDVPVRDFFDPGLFLQHYASAAALYVSGGTLLGEAALTVFFMSFGAAIVYVMATRVSRSWIIGAAATAIAVATFPRLYNYPKVFLFVLAIASAWRYQFQPTRASTCLLAAATALAFLFRHDLGAYIGIAVVAFLVLVHWPPSAGDVRPLAQASGLYIAVTMLLVLPFIVFIQTTVGIPRYLAGLTSQAREITTFRVNTPPVRFDWTKPLVHIDPPTERRIHVRWNANTTNDTRREREARYGLSRPLYNEGTTWSYVITNAHRDNIAALLSDSLVDDTNGIDRDQAEVAVRESLFRRAQRWIPALRMQLAPGVLTFDNALAWLYYVTLVLPFVAVLALLKRRKHSRRDGSVDDCAIIGMVIVLCVVVGQSLVREAPDTRLPDVAAPMAVLGAWLAGTWTESSTRRIRARVAATLAFGSITLWSASAFGELGDRLVTTGVLGGTSAVKERFEKVHEYLTTQPPIDAWTDREIIGLRALAHWLRACTESSDRLLVAGWAADLYFYAERPFAGGQVYLYPDWHSSVADQQLTVQRLERQRVPIVISPVESELVTRQSFPIVLDYVDQHYAQAARLNFGPPWEYDVLVRRDIAPTGTYELLNLPCYR